MDVWVRWRGRSACGTEDGLWCCAGYLVTPGLQEFGDGQDAPKLLAEEAGVWVYERPTALPRAWIVQQIEVMDDEATLARTHDPSFDPLATALVGERVDCGSTGEDAIAMLLTDEGNFITADVEGGGGLLVFSEVGYPGWRATVDGAPVPLVRADYLVRANACWPGRTASNSYAIRPSGGSDW